MRARHHILTAVLTFGLFPMAWAQTSAKAPVPAEAASGTGDPALEKPSRQVTVMSFLEWKSLRVHEAQQKLEQMNKGTTAEVWQEGKPTPTSAEKPSEQKLNFNVDVALQLNVQDYFSMYLKSLGPEEFKEATKKLSPDEVSELLVAYKNSMEKEIKLPLKFSKSPKNNAKGKNREI